MITRKRLEALLERDKRTIKAIEVTYAGKGKTVRYTDINKINWGPITKLVVEFEESILILKGYDWSTDTPWLRPENKITLKDRK